MRSIWTCQSHRHCKTRHQWLDIKNVVGGVYVTVSCSDNEIVGIEAGCSGCSIPIYILITVNRTQSTDS